MSHAAYVLSVLGESPSVLSELLWWLIVRERRSLAGIEVWATGRGADRLRALVASPAWQELQAQTGPLPPLLAQDSPPDASHGFRVHRFELEGQVLDDVRSAEESAAVSGALHDRVRTLRRSLGPHIALVGSLAGGRKTVSAALQTAFSLQAGPQDRLVHVLLDETLEACLRASDELLHYCAPSEAWEAQTGVPEHEQVLVYDVPFPRIRGIAPRRLIDALDRLDWEQVWPELEANRDSQAHARLRRQNHQRWHYEIVDEQGALLWETPLSRRHGALLAAMVHQTHEAGTADIVAWLDERCPGWKVPSGTGHDEETRARAVRGAAAELRRALKDIPMGLERFAPPPQGFHVAGRVQVIGLDGAPIS